MFQRDSRLGLYVVLDGGRDLRGADEHRLASEHARAVELLHDAGRGGAVAQVQHRIGRVGQVVGGPVAEQQGLQQRGHQQEDAAAGLLEQRQQLLAEQEADGPQTGDESFDHGHQSRVLRSVARVAHSSTSM